MKLCKDCIHCKAIRLKSGWFVLYDVLNEEINDDNARCFYYANNKEMVSLITGNLIYTSDITSCQTNRFDENLCGRSGKFFMPSTKNNE